MRPITAEEEFSKNTELKREDVEHLRQWMSEQPHLPRGVTGKQRIILHCVKFIIYITDDNYSHCVKSIQYTHNHIAPNLPKTCNFDVKFPSSIHAMSRCSPYSSFNDNQRLDSQQGHEIVFFKMSIPPPIQWVQEALSPAVKTGMAWSWPLISIQCRS
jgi:hypothetical protein